MKLNNLEIKPGSRQAKKRVGRGNASGNGTTAGRGMNGQKSRSGSKTRSYFEGGQMPLSRRVPKRGFYNNFKKKYSIINISQLNRFRDEEIVTPEKLLEIGLVKKVMDGIKILSQGTLDKKLTIRAHRFSQEAIKKIEKAGGKAEVI
jgi:large subunit ribosomal protein L15